MSRRKDETYGKALDLWQAPSDAGEPLICIATTYTFDPTFFETECVGRFLQMDAHPTESASIAYLIEREEKLAGARVHALVDRRHARDKESLRWDIIGVLVPRAVQHAKLSILAWKDHVRVIIGSGNLTEPGYRKNVEVFGTLELSREYGGNKSAFTTILGFLDEVVEFGIGADIAQTPKGRLRDSLRQLRHHIRTWREREDALEGMPVFNSPTQSVIRRVEQLWPSGGPAREAYVVSPFFDHSPNDGLAAEGLKRLLAKRGDIYSSFHVKTELLLDGQTRVYAPKRIAEPSRAGDKIEVTPLLAEQQGEIREVHSKLLSVGNADWRLTMIGSSNFTVAGLGLTEDRGNLEANLVYRAKTSARSFKQLNRIRPDHSETPLDIGSAQLLWQPCFEEDEDGEGFSPLPAAFQEALFAPGEKALLKLTLVDPLPTDWTVRVPAGRTLLTSSRAFAGLHSVPWGETSPPFVLEVNWQQRDSPAMAANWPVNVSNPAALPPPEVLRSLTLDELLDILASIRPLPAAVAEAIHKRGNGSSLNPSLDPLRRLDSQAYLLRRTKRVARALDRLRERLERPALSKDAFEWRLRGAVGPMALADALVKEARLPGEAKFCLAELALTLRRVDPRVAAQGGLAVDVIRASIDDAIKDIETRARSLESSKETTMLDRYVTEAFREAAAR